MRQKCVLILRSERINQPELTLIATITLIVYEILVFLSSVFDLNECAKVFCKQLCFSIIELKLFFENLVSKII